MLGKSSVPRKWVFPGDRVESPNGTGMLIAENQYVLQMEKAGLLSMPAPTARELQRLTRQVARNIGFDRVQSKTDRRLFPFLHDHIKHVIYVLKFNRTYDQVLGDLAETNGDSRLIRFPELIAPNHHWIAKNFVTLDNFFVSGAVGWTGWEWSTAAQTRDLLERAEPLSMAGGAAKFDNGLDANIRTTNTANATTQNPVTAASLFNSQWITDRPPSLRYELSCAGGQAGWVWRAASTRGRNRVGRRGLRSSRR
jgi:hypothetical protein